VGESAWPGSEGTRCKDHEGEEGWSGRVGQGSIHLQMTGQAAGDVEDEEGGRTRGLASEHSAPLEQNSKRQACPPGVHNLNPTPGVGKGET
jgi:hypothetical protein